MLNVQEMRSCSLYIFTQEEVVSSRTLEREAPFVLSFSLAFLGVFVSVVISIVFIVGSFISDNTVEYGPPDDAPDKEIPNCE